VDAELARSGVRVHWQTRSAFRRLLSLRPGRLPPTCALKDMLVDVSYPPVRSSLWLRLIGSGAFAAFAIGFGIWVAEQRPIGSIVLIVGGGYFAFVSVCFIRQLVDPTGLTADSEGFSYREMWERRRVTWSQVSEFKVFKYRTIRVIGFDLANAQDTTTRRVNRSSMGVSDYIFAHNFAAPIEEVCARLNDLRRLAIRASSV